MRSHTASNYTTAATAATTGAAAGALSHTHRTHTAVCESAPVQIISAFICVRGCECVGVGRGPTCAAAAAAAAAAAVIISSGYSSRASIHCGSAASLCNTMTTAAAASSYRVIGLVQAVQQQLLQQL
eukprot:17489-Heterococcus_DN1.PRE.1